MYQGHEICNMVMFYNIWEAANVLFGKSLPVPKRRITNETVVIYSLTV